MGDINQSPFVLITGGFGYVGGRVAQYLAEKGYQVVLGSRNKQSTPEWLPQSEVVQLIWNDEDALTEACKDVNIVVHSAGMNAQDCAADPVAALEFNGLATARLVRASKRAGVTKFLYLSTAHVYRSPLVGEINENTCPRNLHPYATSHLAGEQAVLFASESVSGFHGTALRLSNVIGAPVHKDVNCWMLVVNDLCRQAVLSNRLKLSSNGLQKRDFVSMAEVCRRINSLMSRVDSVIGSGVVNIGSGVSLSINELSKTIMERYKLIYGKTPNFKLLSDKYNSNDCELEYKSLSKVDISYNDVIADIEDSIDEVLQFCGEAFIDA